MEELPPFITSAVSFLGGLLAKKAKAMAGKGLDAASEQVMSWLRDKLKSPAQAGALLEFTDDPAAEDGQTMLRAALAARLKGEPGLAEELAALLRAAGASPPTVGQTATASGGSTVIQIAGDGNKVG